MDRGARYLRIASAAFMLVAACVGPLPLWLHHELSHHHGHAALENASTGHTGCCHHHASSDCEPATDDSPHWDAVEDDCAICYQLSQSGTVTAVDALSAGLAMHPLPRIAPECLFPAADCVYPARGPPVC